MGKYESLFSLALVVLAFLIFKLTNCTNAFVIALLTPLVALIHEFLHMVAFKIFGVRYRFKLTYTKIGFMVRFSKSRDYIACALFPQILTLILFAAALVAMKELLVVALIHIAMSAHDILKSFTYLINDHRA